MNLEAREKLIDMLLNECIWIAGKENAPFGNDSVLSRLKRIKEMLLKKKDKK